MAYQVGSCVHTCLLFCSLGDYTSVCYVRCNGHEEKITECQIQLGCRCYNAVGIECSKYFID